MSDEIGAARHRVRLQSPSRSGDPLGGATISWVDAGEVWASIAAPGAVTTVDFDTAPSVNSYALTIRRNGEVRPGWRALWGGKILRVVGVRDGGEARIELVCEEEIL